MEESLKLSMRGPATAKPAMGKAAIMSRLAQPAKEKGELSKCIRWAQECINKFKRIAILVKARVRSSLKDQNAKDA